jgi:pimeloyl-ACP methyl ester carboxylesterase
MTTIEDLWITAPDGLRLHALAAGPRTQPNLCGLRNPDASMRLPVVCLPGLARTAEDFRELIEALGQDAERPRRVVALDSRGRGLSERDRDPANYSVAVELSDLLAVLDANGIGRAVFVGVSRGGILIMALAAARPRAIAGAALVDIGPVIEMAGLLRLKRYVGRLPRPESWEEAVALLRSVMGAQFPALDKQTWLTLARRTWSVNSEQGFEPLYDPALSETLENLDPSEPVASLWPQFDALAAAPVLVLRGEHSDILSRATLAAMRARRSDLEAVEIAGQGHPPLLIDPVTIGPIAGFVARCDQFTSS